MSYDEIKRLMDDMGNSKIDSLDIEFPDGIKISMKKNDILTNNQEVSYIAPQVQTSQINVNTTQVEEKEDEKLNIVTSPMVGTFYESSSPKEPALVKVGDKVKKGDVLCIVEAMKLMNEIECEFDGEIVEICAKNEDIVEFGKPLFKIK